MPNPDSKKKNSRFYGFVVAYYRNDPYLMLEKFSSQLTDVAKTVSIDWSESKSNVSLTGDIIKGRDVVGLEKADSSRVSIVGFENTHTWDIDGQSYTVKYPTIRFKNFRKHFPEPAIFDGYKALLDEYESYRGGTRVSRLNSNSIKKNAYIENTKKRKETEAALKAEAINKDHRWLKLLTRLQSPCPYFDKKGVSELHNWVDLYSGETTMGRLVGTFTAIKLVDLKGWTFRGIQRIYPNTNEKTFRKNLDPSGACFTVPARKPINGEIIYVMESPADSGMTFKLTECYSVAALYADNISSVASQLRLMCPDSPIVLIADNDQYGTAPNKGVEVCETTLRATAGSTYMIIPQFDRKEKALQFKDLTDFTLAYGEEAALDFLTSYKS